MSIQPEVGEWYRLQESLFEVVAVDDDDHTIEVQHFDGTIEEMDHDDWTQLVADGALQAAEAPDDSSGSMDGEDEDESAASRGGYGGDQQLAGGLSDLDVFDAP